jgi:hypothetical protein
MMLAAVQQLPTFHALAEVKQQVTEVDAIASAAWCAACILIFCVVMVCSCRAVFPDVPILLCNYHVQNAWQKNLLEKVRDQDIREEMFQTLCKLQELAAFSDAGEVDLPALDRAVELAVADFMQKYAAEPAFCKYFQDEWVASKKLCTCPPLFLRAARSTSSFAAQPYCYMTIFFCTSSWFLQFWVVCT